MGRQRRRGGQSLEPVRSVSRPVVPLTPVLPPLLRIGVAMIRQRPPGPTCWLSSARLAGQ